MFYSSSISLETWKEMSMHVHHVGRNVNVRILREFHEKALILSGYFDIKLLLETYLILINTTGIEILKIFQKFKSHLLGLVFGN